MDLYTHTCFECSKLVTNTYSTSFSQGINAFEKRFRYPVYAIYGFVRYADEIADTFSRYNQRQLMSAFKEEAFIAIDRGLSLNPVIHAFQQTVNQYHIEKELILAFFRSMEMDLEPRQYDEDAYETYIYGSAGVIGLMCLRVFCENNDELYKRLRPGACKLGSALQKINFLRDIKADYHDRGRTYFPGVDFNNFTEDVKANIEADISKDFITGFEGIKLLPRGARLGVYLAYDYYRQLLQKIINTPANIIQQKRIRISNPRKKALYLRAILKQQLNKI